MIKFNFRNGAFTGETEVWGGPIWKPAGTDVETSYHASLQDLCGVIDRALIGNINHGNKAYFVIIKGGPQQYTLEQVTKQVEDILNGDFSAIVNHEENLLGNPHGGDVNVYWDVNNSVVVVRGKETLGKMVTFLRWVPYSPCAQYFSSPEARQKLLEREDSPFAENDKVFLKH